jgi:NAD(P)-dependent dehydrogenase (short-subunit alcohol dehydrogenase family)
MVSRLWGRLDILIANAAVLGPMLELRQVADAAWLETIDTNLTANWRLLRAFDPLLRRSEAGRVVILTSSAASRLKPRRGPYAISKAALEVLAKTYALETENTRIRVNLVDPGPLNTAMRAAAVPNENRSVLPRVGEVAPLVVGLAAPSWVGSGQLLSFAEWRSLHE